MSGRDVAGRALPSFPRRGFRGLERRFESSCPSGPGVAWLDRIDVFRRELFQGRG